MRVEELASDEALMAGLQSAKSIEEAAELLKEKGIEFFGNENESGELDESSLDSVAGGVSVLSWIRSLLSSGSGKGGAFSGGGGGAFGGGGGGGR